MLLLFNYYRYIDSRLTWSSDGNPDHSLYVLISQIKDLKQTCGSLFSSESKNYHNYHDDDNHQHNYDQYNHDYDSDHYYYSDNNLHFYH